MLGEKQCIIVLFFYVGGKLLFRQLPLLEIDGMNLVQHNATLRYVVEKGKLIPDDPKDRVRYYLFIYCKIIGRKYVNCTSQNEWGYPFRLK